MSLTFCAGFCLLRFVQDVEACLHRIFPPKEFRHKSRALEISDPVAAFSIVFYCFWCRIRILTSSANFDIRFVICKKIWPFSKKKVSHSEARFESYSTLKSVYGGTGHTLVPRLIIIIILYFHFFQRPSANFFRTKEDMDLGFSPKFHQFIPLCNYLVQFCLLFTVFLKNGFVWKWLTWFRLAESMIF